MIIVATFGSWLKEQDKRPDAVGEIARFWAEHGVPKVHSPSGIRNHLANMQAISRNSDGKQPVTEIESWLIEAEQEYRNSRGLAAVSSPPPVHPVAAIAEPPRPTQLDRIEAKLNTILTLLGVEPDEAERAGYPGPEQAWGNDADAQQAWAELADDEIDYNGLWLAADHSAAEEL